VSRYELGLRVAPAHGFDPELLHPIRQSEVELPAPRPLDVSLDSSRLERETGWRARPLDAALAEGRALEA
jgi:dTDP-4-dehydrorhamnose reductase